MSDSVSKEKRSQIMSSVRSKGNEATEMSLIRIFRKHQVTGWRRHRPIPGKPDFVFPRHRLAVFVDGCFWHGCRRHCRMPQDNRRNWQQKTSRNAARDRKTTRLLRRVGWRVLRIWKHYLKNCLL